MSYLKEISSLTNNLCEVFEFNKMLIDAINASHEGIAMLDEDGNYKYMNTAHEHMFGYDKNELIGKSWETLYTKETVTWFLENVTPIILKDGYWSGEVNAISKDGVTVVEQVVYLTALPNGGLICTCRDKNFDNRKWKI